MQHTHEIVTTHNSRTVYNIHPIRKTQTTNNRLTHLQDLYFKPQIIYRHRTHIYYSYTRKRLKNPHYKGTQFTHTKQEFTDHTTTRTKQHKDHIQN